MHDLMDGHRSALESCAGPDDAYVGYQKLWDLRNHGLQIQHHAFMTL